MNANELADVFNTYDEPHDWGIQAQTMLRQQQAEIEALKKEAALQRLSDFTQEADNEPVAWINLQKWKDTSSYLEDCVADMKLESAGIVTPLYTHPAKTLTDEEIDNALTESFNRGARFGYAEGLKKASDK